jgi:2-polyprenyl-6-methoxyphenol hydroxylase-like FAD-dependent oxidoreductase
MSLPHIHDRYDVVIAGARCAGASTAMLLARRGLRVLVVDPLPLGRDTLSTHALMRGGVLQLHRWGLLDAVRAAGTPAIDATTFDYGDDPIVIPIKAKDGVDALYAPRRTVLDPILVEAAMEAGADVVHGLAVVELIKDASGRVRGARLSGGAGQSRTVSADVVIGADGLRSRIARLVEAPIEHTATHATASIYGYWKGLGDVGYRWYFRPGIGIGTIPTNDGDTCVFASVSQRKFSQGLSQGLESIFHATIATADPELSAQLDDTCSSGTLKAFPGVPGFLRRAWGPGWALVGDAGYFRDPLTAHGITDAFRDAELLARAVSHGSDAALRDYQLARDGVARGLMDVTDRIASMSWSMDEVKALHQTLSREMNTALEAVRDFDAQSPSSRLSHARATSQSRFTVAGDRPMVAAVSSRLMPAK